MNHIADDPPDVVRAAGAVLAKDGRIAVVHRPKYDDWTLPKGKHEPGEDDVAAALREVREETGHDAVIERELGRVEYPVESDGRRRRKVVHYYAMRPVGGEFVPHDEIDKLRWVTSEEARELLTHERDREVVDRWLQGHASSV
ncbi:MAG: 8-oxo-(d)GTP phosphatase [Gaiellales bacterium]|jgi:8-oxo-dGTP diphosphatase|nr:8-oxo-(d)GTP phosphatase [Gaiellales bacterium]MDX6593526.1 8-oxo-(d)GTP phosphatase [Gaiellales bacterium]